MDTWRLSNSAWLSKTRQYDNGFMAASQKRRMHTVPEGYFGAFAIADPEREVPAVWRFDREGNAKIISINNAEVKNDIYTVIGKTGEGDTGIEDIFCRVEGTFCTAREFFLSQNVPTKDQWTALVRFTAAQLLRTPRFFQLVRDGLQADGTTVEEDSLPRAMLDLIDRWIPRLVKMNGIVAYNETTVPLITCDNPASPWRQDGSMVRCGALNQSDPHLVISCPLTPRLAFVAYQTRQSLEAVRAERYDLDRSRRPSWTARSHVAAGTLPEFEVARLNLVTVLNAQRFVYANNCSDQLMGFLDQHFVGAPAPVRARDLQPIGSPVTTPASR